MKLTAAFALLFILSQPVFAVENVVTCNENNFVISRTTNSPSGYLLIFRNEVFDHFNELGLIPSKYITVSPQGDSVREFIYPIKQNSYYADYFYFAPIALPQLESAWLDVQRDIHTNKMSARVSANLKTLTEFQFDNCHFSVY